MKLCFDSGDWSPTCLFGSLINKFKNPPQGTGRFENRLSMRLVMPDKTVAIEQQQRKGAGKDNKSKKKMKRWMTRSKQAKKRTQNNIWNLPTPTATLSLHRPVTGSAITCVMFANYLFSFLLFVVTFSSTSSSSFTITTPHMHNRLCLPRTGVINFYFLRYR